MKKFTTRDFIAKASAIHGSKYDYSLVDYIGSKIKVKIICKKHGVFLQNPSAHINKRNGCELCAREFTSEYNTLDTTSFILNCKLVHGDRFDYSKTVYSGNRNDVVITCKIHGDFVQKAAVHVNGSICKKCAGTDSSKRQLRSREEILHKCTSVHGSNYNYDSTIFKSAHDFITILCRTHGEFVQTLSNHTRGNGCPSCAKSGFNTSKLGSLYVLQFGEITKIGITNRQVSLRVKDINAKSGKSFKELYHLEDSGKFIFGLEKQLLKELSDSYESVREVFDGYTECFYNVDVTKLINRIEELKENKWQA